MPRYKAGVIGCGKIGVEFNDCHAQAYKDCPDTELIYFDDSNSERALQAYKKWNVPHFLEYSFNNDRLYMKEIDILSICTPPETHRVVLMKSLLLHPNLKAVYMEKPLALTLDDADAMIKTCHDRGVILQVNHQRRFGRPTMYFNRGILNNGTHAIDMLRMLFGDVTKTEGHTLFFDWFEVDLIETPYSEKTDFRFEIPTSILKGVEHLVECIKMHSQSISSGDEAREDLRLCLEYECSKEAR